MITTALFSIRGQYQIKIEACSKFLLTMSCQMNHNLTNRSMISRIYLLIILESISLILSSKISCLASYVGNTEALHDNSYNEKPAKIEESEDNVEFCFTRSSIIML